MEDSSLVVLSSVMGVISRGTYPIWVAFGIRKNSVGFGRERITSDEGEAFTRKNRDLVQALEPVRNFVFQIRISGGRKFDFQSPDILRPKCRESEFANRL